MQDQRLASLHPDQLAGALESAVLDVATDLGTYALNGGEPAESLLTHGWTPTEIITELDTSSTGAGSLRRPPMREQQAPALEQEAAFTAPSFGGISLHWLGYRRRRVAAQVGLPGAFGGAHQVDAHDGAGQYVDDCQLSRVVMVGDDRVQEIETRELRRLGDGECCAGCSQVGVC